MWYVEKLFSINSITDERVPLVYVELSRHIRNTVHVVFRNRETGERQEMASGMSEALSGFAGRFEPYGCTWWPSWSANPALRHRVLIAVSPLAWQFLEYVDAVYEVSLQPGSKLATQLLTIEARNSNLRYKMLDNLGSLINLRAVINAVSIPCTLLDAILYGPYMLVDNNIYLLGANTQSGSIFLQIRLNDVSKVRSLLGKAAVMKYNPIQDSFER